MYNQQFNLEQVSFAAQSAKDTAVQVQAMQAASKELKTQFKSKVGVEGGGGRVETSPPSAFDSAAQFQPRLLNLKDK